MWVKDFGVVGIVVILCRKLKCVWCWGFLSWYVCVIRVEMNCDECYVGYV